MPCLQRGRPARHSRGVSCSMGESQPAVSVTRTSAKLGLSFRGSAASSIGPSWVRPVPVQRLPFPAASFGFSLFAVVRRVSRLRHSSLRVTCLLEAQPSINCPRMRTRRRLSCDFVPYSARQKQASVSPGDSKPRHCPSSRFLTFSTSYSACNPSQLVSSGLRSWGSTESGSSPRPFDRGRADRARASSSRLSPIP